MSPIEAEDLKRVQDGSLKDRLVKWVRVQLRIKVSFSLAFPRICVEQVNPGRV